MCGNLGMFGELFWFPRQCGWKDRTGWLWWGWGGKDLEVSLMGCTSLWLVHRGGKPQDDGKVCCLYRWKLPCGDTALLSLDRACGKRARACGPAAEPEDMTSGVKAVSGKGALLLPTHDAEDTLVEGDSGHEFGVKGYSILKETGLSMKIWGGTF